MNISDNILKNHLKNVLFISGTAYGGKTTMTKMIEKKYGIKRYREGTQWDEHIKYANEKYQPAMTYKPSDFNKFFNRPVKEYSKWLIDTVYEQAEMAIIDLIKMSKNQKIIADVIIPVEYLLKIADYNQVILLVASPEMIRDHYFDRADKRDVYDCIMSMPNPNQTLENVKNALTYDSSRLSYKQFCDSGFKYIKRNEHSTIEDTFKIIEKHFDLDKYHATRD